MATEAARTFNTDRHLQSGKRSIPIVGQPAPDLNQSTRNKIQSVARGILEDEPSLSDTTAFGDQVCPGLIDAPALFIGDGSEIALMSDRQNQFYGYRLSLLGEEGDLVLFDAKRDSAFEYYRSDVLGLGDIEFLHVPHELGSRLPMAWRATDNPKIFARLSDWAQTHHRINLIPHIGSESVWRLAGRLSAISGTSIYVAAPPPRLGAYANNKVWFANTVTQLLGSHSIPPMHGVYGPKALASTLAVFARKYDRVVVKVPDSAGSLGNFSFNSNDLRDLTRVDIEKQCLHLLHTRGWHDTYPVLVEVWDTNVIAAPSVQMWIPSRAECDPVVEGIFEQVVQGSQGEFIGSKGSQLPENVLDRIMEQAMQIAMLFQELGYFGRCSFDAVMVGADISTAEIHWIECNGRWGGVSIPMTLVNRLTGSSAKHPFAVQRIQRNNASFDTETYERILGTEHLYDIKSQEGAVLLAPPENEHGIRAHVVSIGSNACRLDRLVYFTTPLIE